MIYVEYQKAKMLQKILSMVPAAGVPLAWGIEAPAPVVGVLFW